MWSHRGYPSGSRSDNGDRSSKALRAPPESQGDWERGSKRSQLLVRQCAADQLLRGKGRPDVTPGRSLSSNLLFQKIAQRVEIAAVSEETRGNSRLLQRCRCVRAGATYRNADAPDVFGSTSTQELVGYHVVGARPPNRRRRHETASGESLQRVTNVCRHYCAERLVIERSSSAREGEQEAGIGRRQVAQAVANGVKHRQMRHIERSVEAFPVPPNPPVFEPLTHQLQDVQG